MWRRTTFRQHVCNDGGFCSSTQARYNGTEKELAVIPAPSMIGQMGLVDGSARSATCRAASAIKGILISKQTFNSLLQEQSPEGSAFRHLLISTMMGQLSSANEKISGLVDDMVEEQTAEIPIETTQQANKDKRDTTDENCWRSGWMGLVPRKKTSMDWRDFSKNNLSWMKT